jgi:hypothetical protein
MGAVTAADAVLTLNIPLVFPGGPVQLQGFANDEVFDIPAIKSAETMMGVDGVLSSGFVFVPVMQTISLQADSASNLVFDTWWAQMQATLATLLASGLIVLPSIGTKYTLSNGILTSYKPASNAKKLLQPRTYEITWQNIAPAPSGQ